MQGHSIELYHEQMANMMQTVSDVEHEAELAMERAEAAEQTTLRVSQSGESILGRFAVIKAVSIIKRRLRAKREDRIRAVAEAAAKNTLTVLTNELAQAELAMQSAAEREWSAQAQVNELREARASRVHAGTVTDLTMSDISSEATAEDARAEKRGEDERLKFEAARKEWAAAMDTAEQRTKALARDLAVAVSDASTAKAEAASQKAKASSISRTKVPLARMLHLYLKAARLQQRQKGLFRKGI